MRQTMHGNGPPGASWQKYAYLSAALLYMSLIFLLSARSGLDMGIPGQWDKPAHFVEYAVLGILLSRGIGTGRWRLPLVVAIAVLYGFTDELHQSFVPGRDASIWDVCADGLGALGGAGMIHLSGRVSAKRSTSVSGPAGGSADRGTGFSGRGRSS